MNENFLCQRCMHLGVFVGKRERERVKTLGQVENYCYCSLT